MAMKFRSVAELKREIKTLANPEIAEHSQRFFKTGPGEYGEGDKFHGIRVPVLRKLAKRALELSLTEIKRLLHSKMHEERLVALLILVGKYQRADDDQRQAVYDLYRANLVYINNWDLVDSSAHLIMGPHLRDTDRSTLMKLARSDNLWERRVAMMSTLAFIKEGDFDTTLQIAEMLVNDSEDLIHKSVGWMLREVGNRNRPCEEAFLARHYRSMPRTMLRYAIEKFPETRRKKYLAGKI